VAVLEGFSFAVAVIIGVGQFNSALGLINEPGMVKHAEVHSNVIETFSYIGEAKPTDYWPFVFFFLLLFILVHLPPPHHMNADGTKGKPKPKLPWLAVTCLLGLIYGVVTYNFFHDYKPKLLVDAYPSVTTDQLFKFTHYEKIATIPIGPVIFGSIKVAIVAIFETLVSAIIAQSKF